MPRLLAVDLGLRTGLAVYGDDGRLGWYRSHNLGSVSRLRRAVDNVLDEAGEDLVAVVLEGDRRLGEIWQRAAARRGVDVRWVRPEVWRQRLMYGREQDSGLTAKRNAGLLARRVIEWSGAARPTSLRTDAAEAILIGLWAVLDRGWLRRLPPLRA